MKNILLTVLVEIAQHVVPVLVKAAVKSTQTKADDALYRAVVEGIKVEN